MTFTDETLGALLVGFAVSSAIFGVLCSQCYTYFRKYPADRIVFKVLVFLIWLCETVDQALIGHTVYTYTITFFNQPERIFTDKIPSSLITHTVIAFTIGMFVKMVFAMRVWRFSNSNVPVTGTILILTLADFGLGLVYAAKSYQHMSILYAPKLKSYATAALTAGIVADVFTALALCYYLRRFRTGYSRADSVVNSLMIYAINTGALTSIFSILEIVLYLAESQTFEFIGLYFVLSKLYANSLMCNLNTRRSVRGEGTDDEEADTTEIARQRNINNAFTHSVQSPNSYDPNFYVVSPTSPRMTSGLSSFTEPKLEVGIQQDVYFERDREGIELSPISSSSTKRPSWMTGIAR